LVKVIGECAGVERLAPAQPISKAILRHDSINSETPKF